MNLVRYCGEVSISRLNSWKGHFSIREGVKVPCLMITGMIWRLSKAFAFSANRRVFSANSNLSSSSMYRQCEVVRACDGVV